MALHCDAVRPHGDPQRGRFVEADDADGDDACLTAGTSVNEICRRAIEVYARRQDDRLARYRELQARLDADPGVSGKRLGKESREALYGALLAERSAKR